MTIEHISYSQYNSYVNCPRSWYLSKIAKAEEKQTWYLPVGTAVHEMIEDRLLRPDGAGSAEDYFYPLISAQMQVEPDLSKWMAGGPEADPIAGDKALQQVKDCYEKALEFLDDIDVWEVEYDASGSLPGLSVPIKAYVDIIGEHKKHGPTILDWKTGSQKPKNNFQLETYAALITEDHPEFRVDAPKSGLWAMLKPGASKARKVDLSHADPDIVGAKYQAVYEKMQKKIYRTEMGFGCKFCYHKENCLPVAGPTERAMFYDKAEEDGFPY